MLCPLKRVTEDIEIRPPNGDTKISEQFCKDLFSKNAKNLKT